MRNYTRNMHQLATYWGPPEPDGLGDLTFPSPTSRLVRWEQKAEVVTDPQGREIVSSAVVYVDRPVELGGYMLLGDVTTADPRNTIAAEVKQVGAVPNLRGTMVLNKAWMVGGKGVAPVGGSAALTNDDGDMLADNSGSAYTIDNPEDL